MSPAPASGPGAAWTGDPIGHRTLPRITRLNEPFWTGGADGQLLVHRCGACRRWLHPPKTRCPACGSRDTAAEPTSGRATLFSYAVNRYPWQPDLTLPYVIALVELVEQADLRLTTNLVDCPLDDIAIDMPLEVVFEHQDGLYVPLFRPSSDAPGS